MYWAADNVRLTFFTTRGQSLLFQKDWNNGKWVSMVMLEEMVIRLNRESLHFNYPRTRYRRDRILRPLLPTNCPYRINHLTSHSGVRRL